MTSERQYWQIAAGAKDRDYRDAFLKYGMAFVGGKTQIKRMEEVKVGDVVILKRGVHEVVAVGEVVERDGKHRGDGDKEWLLDFDGWRLSAYCFVKWHVPEKPVHVSGLARGTISRVHKPEPREKAEKILTRVPAKTKYSPEPGVTKKVEDEEILDFLIQQGLRPGAAEELTSTFNRIRLLARYYYDEHGGKWEGIREHETRTFLVVPLLLALGWAEQQIKIELPAGNRRRADLVCFPDPYRGQQDQQPQLVIETKGFSQGLDYAPEQVCRYAESFPGCEAVVVTNGYCYKAFRRDKNDSFGKTPSAYLNLRTPRNKYPLDPENVEGCLEALRLLLPGR